MDRDFDGQKLIMAAVWIGAIGVFFALFGGFVWGVVELILWVFA